MKKILLIFLLIPILTFSQVRHSSKQLFKDTCTFNKSVLIPNGDVGIGTASPSYKLDVLGNFNALYIDNSSQQYLLTVNDADGILAIATDTTSDKYTSFISLSSMIELKASNSDGTATSKFTGTDGQFIFTDANVGIGTGSPAAKLDVVGNISAVESDTTKSHIIEITDGSIDHYLLINKLGITLAASGSGATGIGLSSTGYTSLSGTGITINGTDYVNCESDTFNVNSDYVVFPSINTMFGIGTSNTPPTSKLTVAQGDIEIKDAGDGIIIKSPNSNCWRMGVSNLGVTTWTSITCP